MAISGRLVSLSLLLPALAVAGLLPPRPCGADEICTYNITATGLDVSQDPPTENIGATWNLMFSYTGPLTYSGGGTLFGWTVTGSPADGWIYDSSASGLGAYNSQAAALVTFDDQNSDGYGIASVTYTFYGSDTFWATTGSQLFDNPPDSTSGAFSTFNSGADPGCTGCSLNLTGLPTPEPATLPLAALACGALLVFWRRRRAPTTGV